MVEFLLVEFIDHELCSLICHRKTPKQKRGYIRKRRARPQCPNCKRLLRNCRAWISRIPYCISGHVHDLHKLIVLFPNCANLWRTPENLLFTEEGKVCLSLCVDLLGKTLVALNPTRLHYATNYSVQITISFSVKNHTCDYYAYAIVNIPLLDGDLDNDMLTAKVKNIILCINDNYRFANEFITVLACSIELLAIECDMQYAQYDNYVERVNKTRIL